MSTRFYLGRSSFTAMNPGTLGSWGNSYKQMYKMETSKQSTSFTTYTISGMGAGTTLMRQFISQPLDGGIAFTTSTTYALVCRFSEGSSSGDIFSRFYLAIVNSSGDVQVISSAQKDGTEFATSLTSRNNTATGILGNYTSSANDRLVLEVGWDKDGSTLTSGSISLGDSSSSDLTQGDADTGINNPWFETSNNITFGGNPGGGGSSTPPPESSPTNSYDFSAGVYIGGVLDEWA